MKTKNLGSLVSAVQLAVVFLAVSTLGVTGQEWEVVYEVPDGQRLADVAYGDGQFIAVGRDQAFVEGRVSPSREFMLSSRNGIDWEPVDIGERAGNLNRVEYEGGEWLVIGSRPARILRSDSGRFWEEAFTSGNDDFRLLDIAYDRENGQWGVSGFNNKDEESSLLRSLSDGAFSTTGLPVSGSPMIAHGDRQWVAVGNGDSKRAPSGSPFLEWNDMSQVFFTDLSQMSFVHFGDNKWVGVSSFPSHFGNLVYSNDGRTWNYAQTDLKFPFIVNFKGGLHYAEALDRWMVLSSEEGGVLLSSDGENWTSEPLPEPRGVSPAAGRAVSYGQRRWVALWGDSILSRGKFPDVREIETGNIGQNPVGSSDDGIPDSWKQRYFPMSYVVDPWLDSDGDKMPLWLEYLLHKFPDTPDRESIVAARVGTHSENLEPCLTLDVRINGEASKSFGKEYRPRFNTSGDLVNWTDQTGEFREAGLPPLQFLAQVE